MEGLIDGDAHVVEAGFFLDALKVWPEHIRLRDDGTLGYVIEGRNYPEPEGPGAGCPADRALNPEAAKEAWHPAGMVADADREGVASMVLYPSGALGAPSIEDPVFAADFSRGYNDWVLDFCAGGAGRLFATAAVPLQVPDVAARITSEAAAAGLVGITVPPALEDRGLDHPSLDPVWAAAEEAGLPVCVHGAPGMHLPKIGIDRFTNYVQVHMISFPFDMMTALAAVVSGGVLDRFPTLRFAFLEAGCGWLPYFVDRMHEHWEKRGDWIEGGWRRSPREYVAEGRIVVTCESEDRQVAQVAADLGAHCVMWASDYPHWDGDFPDAGETMRTRTDLAEDVLEEVCVTTATRFYGLA